MKIGVLTSHPIQYQAPLFRALAREVDLQVFFAHRQMAVQQAEAGFGVAFEWDIDLLDGYPYLFLENCSRHPNVNRFSGCDTPSIRDYIAHGNFDAFLVTGWYLKSHWQALRACRKEGIPVLSRGDSQLLTPRSVFKQVLKPILYRWVLRQFDAHLYVGQRNREYLLHYGVDPQKIFFSPHFVDNDWFRSRAEIADREKQRKELGCNSGEILVLFVGKFIDVKRPLDLILALAQLQQVDVAVKGVFVGAGPLEKEMRHLAEDLKVDAVFAGFKNQTQLPSFYAAADVLVLPSYSETWGLVVNEAMACGLPVVLSESTGCVPDLIQVGKTGEVFPVGDICELANSIRKMLPMLGSREQRNYIEKKMCVYTLGEAAQGILTAVNVLCVDKKTKNQN